MIKANSVARIQGISSLIFKISAMKDIFETKVSFDLPLL